MSIKYTKITSKNSLNMIISVEMIKGGQKK